MSTSLIEIATSSEEPASLHAGRRSGFSLARAQSSRGAQWGPIWKMENDPSRPIVEDELGPISYIIS